MVERRRPVREETMVFKVVAVDGVLFSQASVFDGAQDDALELRVR